jgi:hypothetical protein
VVDFGSVDGAAEAGSSTSAARGTVAGTESATPRIESTGGPARGSSTETAGARAVALVAFAIYVVTLAPAPYLLDSAELAAASFGLGIAHPPGEPLALVLGRLLTLVPLGSVAFRVGLLQACAGALAAAFTYRLALRALAAGDAAIFVPAPAPAPNPVTHALLGPGARHLLAASAALGFALAPGALISSNRPEVYALAAALALGALLLALDAHTREDPRPLLIAAGLIGIGLGNHPLIAGLTGLAPAFVGVLGLLGGALRPRSASRARLIMGAIAAFVVGALVLLYLPVRGFALADPGHADVIAWGDARHLGGLWAILSARTFVAKAAIVHTSATPDAYPFVLFDELGAAAVLLALAGVFFGLRTRGARVPVATFALTALTASLGALWAGFDPLNPDIRGYLLVALAAFAVLAAVGVATFLAGFAAAVPGNWRAQITTGASAAIFVLTLVRALPLPPAANLADRVAADQAVADLQDHLPPRAALATVHFETAFLLAYQRLVEGRRPDLSWLHLGFVRGDGYADRLRVDRPNLTPLIDAHAKGPLTLTAARASGAPGSALAFEPDEHLAPDLQAELVPRGGLWVGRWAMADSPENPASLWPTWMAEAARDRQVRGFLAHRALRDAAVACRRGWPITARLRLAELATLVPQDERARAVRATCPFTPL